MWLYRRTKSRNQEYACTRYLKIKNIQMTNVTFPYYSISFLLFLTLLITFSPYYITSFFLWFLLILIERIISVFMLASLISGEDMWKFPSCLGGKKNCILFIRFLFKKTRILWLGAFNTDLQIDGNIYIYLWQMDPMRGALAAYEALYKYILGFKFQSQPNWVPYQLSYRPTALCIYSWHWFHPYRRNINDFSTSI